MQMVYLDQLQKGRQKVSVCVKVMRKWTVKDNLGQGMPLYTGLVLADSKGNAIYAEISRNVTHMKNDVLHIDKTYVLRRFLVNYAKPAYRPIDGKLMIELTDFTTVDHVSDPVGNFPLYIYNITPFRSIVVAQGAVSTYIDVLGYITKYTAASAFVPRGKENLTVLREIYLRDMSEHEIKVTLWGEQATAFSIDQVYSDSMGNIVVALFVGCIPKKMYNDPEKVNLSAGNASAYYLNPSIKEAEPFYSRFKDHHIYIERPAASEEQLIEQAKSSPLDQKTLAELNDIADPYNFVEQFYKCTVTIARISENSHWWYMSCRVCKKRSNLQAGGGYKCSKCHATETKPRYILTFTAADETSEAEFFAFDEIARSMVLKDCESILNPLKLSATLPPQLQALVSKRFTFSVSLTEDSFTSNAKRKYLVMSILDRSDRNSSPAAAPTSRTIGPSTSSVCPTSASHDALRSTVQSTEANLHIIVPASTHEATPPAPDHSRRALDKDTDTSAQADTPSARKALFTATSPAETESLLRQNVETSDADQEERTTQNEVQLQRKRKRSKTDASKDVTTCGDHSTRKQMPPSSLAEWSLDPD